MINSEQCFEHTSDTNNETPVADGDLIAAVDLGSNSFHSVIARNVGGTLFVVDRIKDMVRLAEGLSSKNRLHPAVQERALESLERFGDRLRSIPSTHVRVVGTNTLRKAKNSRDFLRRAETALGHKIQIISGYEEARLIYLGVAHTIGKLSDERRLVVDIGGGSTEFVIGRGFDTEISDSKYMGCVSYTQKYFKDKKITKAAFLKAELAAQQEIQDISPIYRKKGWDLSVGASGTIKAIYDVIQQNQFGDSGITLEQLKAIKKHLIKVGDINKINLPGLSERRRPVFVGGLAILIGIFKSLKVNKMIVSDGALREGLLYDLLGRMQNTDKRDQTIQEFANRYAVDLEQAQRVETTSLRILEQIKDAWQLNDDPTYCKMLVWASTIHEIGIAISHSRYHKHGSYIVENSDMSGFSRGDQKFLWAMIRSHRRDFKLHRFDGLAFPYPTQAPRLTIALRLAAILCRSRQESVIPDFHIDIQGKNLDHLVLSFPPGFLALHPLLAADLEEEAVHLNTVNIMLQIKEMD